MLVPADTIIASSFYLVALFERVTTADVSKVLQPFDGSRRSARASICSQVNSEKC